MVEEACVRMWFVYALRLQVGVWFRIKTMQDER
jgi:hypothetical protein